MPTVVLAPAAALQAPAGEQALGRRFPTGQAGVVHVGQSAVLLTGDDGTDLLVVTGAERGLTPGGVHVPEAALDRLCQDLAAAGADAVVDLTGWCAAPVRRVDLRVPRVVPDPTALSLLHTAVHEGPGAVTAATADVMDPGPQRALAGKTAVAALTADRRAAADLLGRLVGAGPGATPAGDDVLVGVLAALYAVPHPAAVAAVELLADLLTPLLDHTTRASRQDLRAAAAGRFARHIHNQVRALGAADRVPSAVSAAQRRGATSGTDLLCGLVHAATVLSAPVVAPEPVAPTSPTRPTASTNRRSA